MLTASPALPGDQALRRSPDRHPQRPPRRLMCLLAIPALLLCAHGAALAQGKVQAWITTGDQAQLLARGADAAFGAGAKAATVIEVDPSQRYQEMVGFGAAITDASAWLIQNRLNPQQRGALMNDLFGKAPGANFSFTRLTIGASDFSRHHYSFDDMPPGQTDPALAHFSIEPNRADVLPVTKAALAINPKLRVMASPWSAPGWMKSTDSLIQGTLKPEAYAPFAAYLSRYVGAYAQEGVPIFALTLQNEPHFEPKDYPGMRVEPAQRAAFIGGHLGPLLAREHPQTRILDWDHNWDEPGSPAAVLQDPVASKYVNGVAWHCYAGDVRVQAALHDRWPDKDTYFTECSGGKWAPVWSDNLNHFARTLVIGATRGWAKGVLLWNLALDENDGPHLGGCKDCRGVVTIDSRDGKVTRNEEYYALAHASRFVRQGARRIASTSGYDDLDTVAFRNADDGSVALLVVNSAKTPRSFAVRLAPGQRSFSYTLPAASVATFTWQP
ncbi:glycosyl hydrolase [Duganella sp. BJB488]|uniref:glycoside hydrolase family 30 protein n=1 Tax=unclassified Duganella TaxID=2636909 RepID=UPI000E342A36|nr:MULTISPECIES: glycoside hydrolase family 30 beta sandwich domain-containing protein [unclassified Duganella]RFP24259.1 glycosyl hydrolase [Duganella sp. BJB489]RFP26620.1 glycosyl hydrolase [Duganella sp. BJB488]RFP34646.1 glycosyl hydrolase [Duganella sp. BJB480]